MTAETLKPFITPQNVENCPTTISSVVATRRQKKNINCLDLSLTILTVLLLAVLLGITIWLAIRVDKSETEISRLNDVIEKMQKNLGMNYLEEAENFENEYRNAIIDNPNTFGQIDYDDDEDENEDDEIYRRKDDLDQYETFDSYDEIKEYIEKKTSGGIGNADDDDDDLDDDVDIDVDGDDDGDDDEDDDDVDSATDNGQDDSNSSADDDNLYEDFEKYNKSRKIKHGTRMVRSIVPELQLKNNTKAPEHIKQAVIPLDNQNIHHKSVLDTIAKERNIVAERSETKHTTPLRPRSHRRRKFPVVKSGDSLLSAKYTSSLLQQSRQNVDKIRPAAHFHLHKKIPERQAGMKVDSYTGDTYIGHHPSWSNELDTEHYFTIENGVLTVHEPGLYYVYAQICYNNSHDQNGFIIFHGQKAFLQCLNTVPTNIPLKIHTCHTSGLIYLQQNETIHLRDIHSDRNVVLRDLNNRSYFGLLKV